MAGPPPPSKVALRAELRAARRAFADGRPFVPIQTVLAALQTLITNSRCVAAYWAIGGEPDVRGFLAHAVDAALPRIDDKGEMRFHRWRDGDATERCLGFCQPVASAAPATPDLIFVPLVGFDRALNRLGQGGGYYDRALLLYPQARKVGIAWSIQEVARLPVEPHDIPLDAILTEKEWIAL